MIYIVNLDRTCKNDNFCHIYVLVVFKDVSFATVPILACGGDNSQVHLYVQSSGQVCFYVAHMSAVSPSTVTLLVNLWACIVLIHTRCKKPCLCKDTRTGSEGWRGHPEVSEANARASHKSQILAEVPITL